MQLRHCLGLLRRQTSPRVRPIEDNNTTQQSVGFVFGGLCKTAQTKRTKCKKSGVVRGWFQSSDALRGLGSDCTAPDAEAARLHDGCGSWNVSTPLHA
jgi:hypothetical protein